MMSYKLYIYITHKDKFCNKEMREEKRERVPCWLDYKVSEKNRPNLIENVSSLVDSSIAFIMPKKLYYIGYL